MTARMGITFWQNEEEWCTEWLELVSPTCISPEYFQKQVKEILSARLQGSSCPERPFTSNRVDHPSVFVEKKKEHLVVDQILDSPTNPEICQETNPVSFPSSFIHVDSAIQKETSAHEESREKKMSDSP